MLLAELFKVLRPLEAGRRIGVGSTTEANAALTEGKEVVHPVRNGIAGSHVALRGFIGLLVWSAIVGTPERFKNTHVEEESILDGGPRGLQRVPVADLVRTPEHGYKLLSDRVGVADIVRGPGVVPGRLGADIVADPARRSRVIPVSVGPGVAELAVRVGDGSVDHSRDGVGLRLRRGRR